jgi:peptidylprolyl isomerase/FKBP-type peptidyl-prolyl cis-trans isomerase FklB
MFRRIAAAVAVVLTMAGCHPKTEQPKPPADSSANADFLAKNAKEPGVVTLPDGLQYKIVTSGPASGEKPRAQDEVKVNYEGRLATGKRAIFDSSFQRGEPANFGLSDGLITGWVEAMELMRPGDEWMVWVPPKLGYGEEDHGPIPGNSVLEFRIQLLGVLKHDTPAAQG